MSIPVQCANCQSRFQVPDHYAGREVKCPQCLGLIVVPGERSPSAPVPRSRPSAKASVQIEVEDGGAPRPAVSTAPEVPASQDVAAPAVSVGPADSPTPAPEMPAGPTPVFDPVVEGRPLQNEGALPEIAPNGGGIPSPAGEPAAAEFTAWYLRAEEAEYGPVTRDELDRWKAEGRIDASCQILAEGWDQWQWADQVYPELAADAVGVAPAPEPQGPTASAFPALDLGETAPRGSEIAPGGFPEIRVASPSPSEAASPIAFPVVEPPVAVPTTATPVHRGGLSPVAIRALAETRPWVTLLGIVGVVLGSLVAIGAATVGIMLLLTAGVLPGLAGLLALVGPALWIVASAYLLIYGRRIRDLLRGEGSGSLDAALVAQRSFWKFAGMIVLATIGLYVLVGGLGLAASMLAQ